ncbi:hypothetical protein [Sulfurimonas sp.]|uniref:hypothetical protein n=1 Tax=Sulfurimonas sp. TaxID=2022749 RepID=UPI0026107DD7|nr:hypothetical protein [Sulfurimonas sp.]
MTQLQEAFLYELKSQAKFTVAEYATLYIKYHSLAVEEEKSKGAGERQAKNMAEYYTLSVLSDFIGNENTMARIIALYKSA